MFNENLIQFRKANGLTQEELSEKIGVSRQTVAKWEAGESIPDIEKCKLIAEIFNISLDFLVAHKNMAKQNLSEPPKGKYLFGTVTVNEKGEITLPATTRQIFGISSGDKLLLLGDEAQGLALIKANDFLNFADAVKKQM